MDRRVAVLGTGKIGGILLQGLLKAGLSPQHVFPTVRRAERATALAQQLSIPVGTDNRAAARQAEIILLCVKPQTARQFFDTVGRTVLVEEKHMDAVTGLSASGPAFVYIILESLAEAGVKVGLPRDVATLLSAQTLHGAARVALETGDHPAQLKDAVTTPAGCTIDGIMELEDGKLRVTLIKAVVKATERAKELILER